MKLLNTYYQKYEPMVVGFQFRTKVFKWYAYKGIRESIINPVTYIRVGTRVEIDNTILCTRFSKSTDDGDITGSVQSSGIFDI